jgi:hypothetical protein
MGLQNSGTHANQQSRLWRRILGHHLALQLGHSAGSGALSAIKFQRISSAANPTRPHRRNTPGSRRKPLELSARMQISVRRGDVAVSERRLHFRKLAPRSIAYEPCACRSQCGDTVAFMPSPAARHRVDRTLDPFRCLLAKSSFEQLTRQIMSAQPLLPDRIGGTNCIFDNRPRAIDLLQQK